MAIVRNIQNNDLYEYLGENKFVNLRTRQAGTIDDETAARVFKINLEATELIAKYPHLKDFIHTLGLRFDNEK